MGIGASKADIDTLKAELGCAFSCHGEKPAKKPVQLRIDVMRDAVSDMIKSAEAEWTKDQSENLKKSQPKAISPRIKIALTKFDHEVFELEQLTSDYQKLKDDMSEIKLHPSSHRGTNAKRALEFITPKVAASGTGMSADSPRRFVFIVTDGLQDRHPSWYPINFPTPHSGNGRLGALDPAACSALKAKGVTVAVLYTTHVGIPGYEWYWQNAQPAIRPNLQACASPNFFFEAKDAAQLSNEFKTMFQKAIQAAMARLEK
jgi:hypothetical protein